jgi:hypothetical protein
LITVINYPQNHWVTLQFLPKREILEVFDSMAPNGVESRIEKIGKVRYPQQLTTISDGLNIK